MCNQLRVQLYKLRHFWVFIIALACMAAAGLVYGLKLSSVGYGVYYVFGETNCDTSFMFCLSLVSAWFVGSDFSSRTIHNEITLGYSRFSVLLARELPACFSAIILHCAYFVSAMAGAANIKDISVNIFKIQDLIWCAVIFLQLIAFQSIIVFITFAFAKAAASISASVSFAFVTCNILRNFFDGKIFTSSCFCLARDNSYSTLTAAGITAFFTIIITVLFTYLVFRQREIK